MPNPTIPADLNATIAHHLELFRGWRMMADDAAADGGDQGEGGEPKEESKDDPADKPLGPNGEKALQRERDARKESDRKVATLESQMSRLAEALGVKSDDAKSKDNDDKVKALADAVGGLIHNSAVDRIAREHQISDKDDLALLREQKTEEAMEKLAKRLQPAENDDDTSAKQKRRTPAPDMSQGRGGGDNQATGVSAGRALFKGTSKTT